MSGRDAIALVFAVAFAVAFDTVVIGLVVRDRVSADTLSATAALVGAWLVAMLVWWRTSDKGATP